MLNITGGVDISSDTDTGDSLAELESAFKKASDLAERVIYWGSVKYRVVGDLLRHEEGVITLPLRLEIANSLDDEEADLNPPLAADLYWHRFWVSLVPELSLGELPVSYWASEGSFSLPSENSGRNLYLSCDDVLTVLARIFHLGQEVIDVPNLEHRRLDRSIMDDHYLVRRHKYNLSYSIATGMLAGLDGPLDIPEVLHKLPPGANQAPCPTLALERSVSEMFSERGLSGLSTDFEASLFVRTPYEK